VLSALNAAGYRAIAVANAMQQQPERRRRVIIAKKNGTLGDGDQEDVVIDNASGGEPSTVNYSI
jgi:hypothetical protein